jgi:hypothetical protein
MGNNLNNNPDPKLRVPAVLVSACMRNSEPPGS